MKTKAIIKLAVSLAMLAVVLLSVDFSALKHTLLNIPPTLVISVILLYAAGQVISSYKWWLIAKSGRISVPYSIALKSYFMGMYINVFGFGTVGGDVTRGILLAQGQPYKTEAITSVLADRAHGLAVLATLAIFAAAIMPPASLDPTFIYALYGIAAIIILGWILGPKMLLKVVPETSRFRNKLEGIAEVFPKSIQKISYITFISLIFHILQIYIHRLMAVKLGIDIPWSNLLVAIPFVNILGSLPISWQGLGVRETAYIFFLANYISSEQAIAFGAMWFLGVTASSAIGGITSAITGDLTTFLGKRSQKEHPRHSNSSDNIKENNERLLQSQNLKN
ncbi:MAG: UPF0104 family protein [Candidatus Dadabacteria bacterium]|nr:MAG: UPF0104 family protein [Candidatus Dadabacteria bacterium]